MPAPICVNVLSFPQEYFGERILHEDINTQNQDADLGHNYSKEWNREKGEMLFKDDKQRLPPLSLELAQRPLYKKTLSLRRTDTKNPPHSPSIHLRPNSNIIYSTKSSLIITIHDHSRLPGNLLFITQVHTIH